MRISSSLLIFALILSVISILVPPRLATAQERNCEELLVEANNLYSRGAFDETIGLLDQCIENDAFSDAQRKIAYRLKGLSFIGKGLEVDARESVKRLLQIVPNYEPDPVMDPPNFVQMITEVRQEINDELQAAPPEVVQDDPVTNPATDPVADPIANTPEQAPATVTKSESKRKKKGATKWILGGLGVAAVGGLVAVLASGGGDGGGSGGDGIAEPPALP